MSDTTSTRERHDRIDTVTIHPRVLTGALVTAVLLTVGIAAASFWLSFAALRELAVMAGTDPGRAWVIPVVLDGAIIATTVTAIALSHHSDPRTVRGRRFVLTVLAVAAGASIAGNAYHATLTSTVLPAVVAAGIATIAPVFLLAMTEVLAVILRAPRNSAIETSTHAVVVADSTGVIEVNRNDDTLHAREAELEADSLNPRVWRTVEMHLTDPDRSYSDIASELGISVSTVTRRIDKWLTAQRDVAASRAANADRTPARVDDPVTVRA